MAKGKSTWKYNKLLTARRNYFGLGTESFDHSIDPWESGITFWSEPVIKKHMTSWFTPEFAKPEDVDISGALNRIGNIPNKKSSFLGLDWSNPFKGNNSNDIKNSLTSAAGSAIGTIGGGLIGGGLQSTAGNVLSGLGNIAAAIPGPWGAATSIGLKGLSGIANRLFGSKLNEENIAKVQSNINALNAFQSNASDYDTLASNWSSAPTGMTFSNSFIGSDGVFSNKAKRMANRLRDQVSAGDLWVSNNLANNAANIDKNQLGNLLSKSAAYGGPIFAKGGTIHINPENKGKFTETKRRTGKTTEELTHSKNPLTRKRAIFAQNAKKWHHAFGGELNTQGGDFTNGLLYIDNGDSHENNPYEGVQLGMDSEGVPNLVEEGETVFNDYVFSRRLMVPKAIRNKYKMGSKKGITFADMSKKLAKESEERPNDPISMRGLEAFMTDLAIAQEGIREAQQPRQYAQGGRLFEDGGTKDNRKIITRHMLRGTDGLTEMPEEAYYYDGRNTSTGKLWNEAFGEKYTILDNGKYTSEYNPATNTETRTYFYTPYNKKKKGVNRYYKKNSSGKYELVSGSNPYLDIQNSGNYRQVRSIANDQDGTDYYYDPEEAAQGYEVLPTYSRYLPAVSLGIANITDAMGITNKPNYSSAEAINEASKNIAKYQPVKFNPNGNYLTYKPFDRDYYITKMDAEANAARRALLNTSGGNRSTAMAGILAADNNYLNKIGDLSRQAEEYNLAQRQKVEDFNRGTNTTNSQGFLQASSDNQKTALAANEAMLKGIMASEELRNKERLIADQARSANLSGFITALGDIGRENMGWNWRNFSIATGAPIGNEERRLLSAKGGKIKRKKGLTI